MKVSLALKSRNAKTGPIPVSMTEQASCPDTCELKGSGCYAESGPMSWTWAKLPQAKTALNWSDFCDKIYSLPKGQLWRHNSAGDLPHSAGTISTVHLDYLVRANVGKRGFTYTHHELHFVNRIQIRAANANGFTINVSANNAYDAVEILEHYKLPAVCVLPSDAPNTQTVTTESGKLTRIVTCPAQQSDKVTCASCGLCADSTRDYVIGFRAHGARKKAANLIATKEVH